MTNLVSITSQGQISIPAKMRRELGFEKYGKALVRKEKGRLVVEPVGDLLESAGIFKEKAIRNKSIAEVMQMEEKAAAEGFAGKLA